MPKYRKHADGEPVRLAKGLGLFMCCDCGLTHIMRATLAVDGEVVIQMWRDNRATAARRRRGKKK